MKHTKRLIAAAAIITATALTACGSSSSGSSSSSCAAGSDSKEITWWATNQAASLDEDLAVLNPELANKAASGVTVNVEVVPWKDLYSRITSAVTSGKGPDVVSIGNTWSSSLQSTGAFTEFDDAAMTLAGNPGS